MQVKIQKECEVRLKIIGTRVDATEIVCTILHNSNLQCNNLYSFNLISSLIDRCLSTFVFDFAVLCGHHQRRFLGSHKRSCSRIGSAGFDSCHVIKLYNSPVPWMFILNHWNLIVTNTCGM